MLLTSIIQLDPPKEAFGDLLAQYVDGSRPEIAEAAHLLRRAWLRDHPDTTDPRLPLPELLRTLGGLLDESRVEVACLTVNADSAHLQTFGPLQQRSLAPRALEQEVAIRRARRGRLPPGATTAPHRYEHLLRAIDAALDGEPADTYEIVVTPRVVVVSSSTGEYHLFTLEQLDALLRAAPYPRELDAAVEPVAAAV